jgi:opacity protein-like surface antigen
MVVRSLATIFFILGVVKMKKIFLSGLLSIVCAATGFAQSDYKKTEVFVGYSNNQVDTGINTEDDNDFEEFFEERETFHGFNASGVYNLSRYFGVKGDVSGAYKRQNFSIPIATGPATTGTLTLRTRDSVYNFLGGVQVKDNADDKRLKPFGYALVGAGHVRTKFNDVSCPAGADCSFFDDDFSETGVAAAFGGGLDIKINDRIDFRAIKIDYNPIRIDSGTQHNVRFGIGVVFK